jgi:hypothetical protein
LVAGVERWFFQGDRELIEVLSSILFIAVMELYQLFSSPRLARSAITRVHPRSGRSFTSCAPCTRRPGLHWRFGGERRRRARLHRFASALMTSMGHEMYPRREAFRKLAANLLSASRFFLAALGLSCTPPAIDVLRCWVRSRSRPRRRTSPTGAWRARPAPPTNSDDRRHCRYRLRSHGTSHARCAPDQFPPTSPF